MARTYTSNLPKHHGERDVALQLSAFDDDGLHLWFSLDFIPGARDIDILLWHELAGVFVIEVKAVPLSSIRLFGLNRCEIDGRPPDRGPHNQAYEAALGLRNYLGPRVTHLPFICATACFPLIVRAEWSARFAHSSEVVEFANRMIFRDDLFAGSSILRSRLRQIWLAPPVRKAATLPFRHDQNALTEFVRLLGASAAPAPTISDAARLTAIERGIKKDILRGFPPGVPRRTCFSGHPGTGKTFRLLQIGIAHAREGYGVLFVCFNKVLASDIRRLINLLALKSPDVGFGPSLKEMFVVVDVFELAAKDVRENGLDVDTEDFDAWGQLVVGDISSNRQKYAMQTFDTVLVDEGQDFKPWQFDLACLHANPIGATVCVAIGLGQNLYESDEPARGWLANFAANGAKTIALRRNFRNTKPSFEFAQGFYECRLESERLQKFLARRKVDDKQGALEFDRPVGQLPTLVNLSELTRLDYDDPEYDLKMAAALRSEFSRILRHELERVQTTARPFDLLVLVPDVHSRETTAVRLSLQDVKNATGVGFIDYTQESTRRMIAPDDNIRVCTFHSSRGLEGAHVVIFGIDRLTHLASHIGVDPFSLGYIVLSRALFETTICVRRDLRSRVVEFLDALVEGMMSDL